MTSTLLDLNLAHVRTLQEVVRRGSFSRAAEDLHLSQPAVSLHIRQLEDKVGLALVERVGKRASPTRAGEILLEHAERAFAELEAARQALQDLRGVGGRVRVGTGATASIHLLPPLLKRLRVRYPELELIVRTGNAPDMARAVVGNELDVAVVTLPVKDPRLSIEPLLTEARAKTAALVEDQRMARQLGGRERRSAAPRPAGGRDGDEGIDAQRLDGERPR